ncbi:MAG: hypothetical protein EXR50_05525, partial [Dehalococcoidia bacterium]|nr:hypothetical protein [Dehalococcoidia bacterium]
MTSERIQRQIDALLDDAEQAIKNSDWALVRDRAKQVLTMDPDNGDGKFYLAAAERGLAAASEGRQEVSEGDSPGRATLSTDPPGRAPSLPAIDGAATADASPKRPLPTSFVNGRYLVKRFLGEGGKKIVYETNDTILDRDVAYAEIKTDGLDEVGRERIKREGQTLGRLGSHPNIVSVHDLGEENGHPYMVTELMEGGDVEA